MEALMWTATRSDPKCDRLREHASLNPHPQQVRDALFQTHPFFDPRDLVQVRYEMLRRVIYDGQPVGATAATFGFSRVRFYQLRKRFAAAGLVGLLPQPKGPRQAHKLSDEVLTFVLQTLQAEPALRSAELPRRMAQQFGFSVHVRSIERALARRRKKAPTPTPCRSRLSLLRYGVPRNVWNNTRAYVAKHWSPGTATSTTVWSWRSSNAGDWPPG
jgi:transposase